MAAKSYSVKTATIYLGGQPIEGRDVYVEYTDDIIGSYWPRKSGLRDAIRRELKYSTPARAYLLKRVKRDAAFREAAKAVRALGDPAAFSRFLEQATQEGAPFSAKPLKQRQVRRLGRMMNEYLESLKSRPHTLAKGIVDEFLKRG